MRTTLDIDEKLLKKAMKITGAKTKKAVVEEGLNELLQRKLRQELIAMAGKTELTITLDELLKMREDD